MSVAVVEEDNKSANDYRENRNVQIDSTSNEKDDMGMSLESGVSESNGMGSTTQDKQYAHISDSVVYQKIIEGQSKNLNDGEL